MSNLKKKTKNGKRQPLYGNHKRKYRKQSEDLMLVTGEKVDPNTPENKVGRN